MKIQLQQLLVAFLCLLVLNMNAQEVRYTFPINGDARIERVIQGNNVDEFLILGKIGHQQYDTTFSPLFLVYNIATKTYRNISPLADDAVAFVSDAEFDDNQIHVLMPFYDFAQDTTDFAIVDLDLDFSISATNSYRSPSFSAQSNIFADKFIYHNNEPYIFGSLRNSYSGSKTLVSGYNQYAAKPSTTGSWIENTGCIYCGTPGYYFVEDVFINNDTISSFLKLSDFFSSIFIFPTSSLNLDTIVNLPFNNSARHDPGNPENDSPRFYDFRFTDIQKISSNKLVSASQRFREWVTLDENNIPILTDSINFGVYFFSQNVDSLKFVNLTQEYKNVNDGPGGSNFINPDRICVASTINNVPGRIKTSAVVLDEYPITNQSKIMATMLDSSGNVLWKRIIESGTSYELITDVLATKDGGCLLAGSRFKEGETTLHDPLLIKLDSTGSVGITENNNKLNIVRIYPNPATDQVRLEWEAVKLSNSSIKIYSITGALVQKMPLSKQNVSLLDVSELTNGEYIVEVQQQNGERFASKLLIRK